MNDRAKPQLLDDVLAESSPPDFRAALLGETLRQARQHRRRRQTRHAGGVLVVAVLAAVLAWQNYPARISLVRPVAEIAAAKNYQLVETQPLAAGALVTSRAFAGVKMISSETPVTVVATSSGGFRFINDDQLLALVGPEPAMLVRTGPDSEELVFAGPVDSSSGRLGN